MKQFFFIVFLLANLSICKAQTESAIFTINSNGIISINSVMIDPLDSGHNINSLSYLPKNPVRFLVGNSTFTVKTSTFKDWDDNEGYGFNVISLYKAESKILEVKQLDSWTFTSGGGSSINFSKYTNNRYFVPIDLSNKAKALFFLGWPYGGDLPYLTIFVVTEQDAKLVFNKNMGLDSIVKSDNQCVIKVQTGLEEYDSNGKLCVAPIFAQMYLKNGVLYLKQ